MTTDPTARIAEIRQKVLRVTVSPMNTKRKVADLACGHEVWVSRAPVVGRAIKCERCTWAAYEKGLVDVR